MEAAAEQQQKSREANAAYFDTYCHRRPERTNTMVGLADYVLLHDTHLDQSHSHKLSDRWNGPYKVTDVLKQDDRRTYQLSELNGMVLDGYFLGDRIK